MSPKFPYQPGMPVSAMHLSPGIGTVLGDATVDRVEKRERDGYRVHVTLHSPGKASAQQSYIVSATGKCDYLISHS